MINGMKKNLIPENINIIITPSAAKQIKLISENDYTLEGQYLRIKISGKECDGFTYQIGFTHKEKDDHIIERNVDSYQYHLLMDRFTAFYTQESTLDFIQDEKKEGFVIINHQQKNHRGKFYKNESLLPPWESQ